MPHRATEFSLGARVYITAVVAAGTLPSERRSMTCRSHRQSPVAGTGGARIPDRFIQYQAPVYQRSDFGFRGVCIRGCLLVWSSAATIIVTLDAIILSSWASSRRRSKVRAAFNIFAAATAIWIAAHLFRLVLPQTPSSPRLEEIIFPVAVLAASYSQSTARLSPLLLRMRSRVPRLRFGSRTSPGSV